MENSRREKESRVLRESNRAERGIAMRGIKSRLIAAVITLAFMYFVRPDPNPSLMGVAFTALLIYEGLRFCIENLYRDRKKREYRQLVLMNRQAMKEAGERLDEMLFNPYREVS